MAEDCDSCAKLEERRGNARNVLAYIRSVLSSAPGYETEAKLLFHAMGAFAALVSVLVLIQVTKAVAIPALLMPLVFISAAVSVALVASYAHITAYKDITCQNGMMAGMTLGMMAGFLLGALFGATNGMFIGSVAGTAGGVLFGFAVGRNCGVMGALEGIMAGLMAGTMGAMLSVMMIGDNLLLFLVLLTIVALFTLGGLSYMMRKEQGGATILKFGFFGFAYRASVLFLLTLAIMLYGPKGPVILS